MLLQPPDHHTDTGLADLQLPGRIRHALALRNLAKYAEIPVRMLCSVPLHARALPSGLSCSSHHLWRITKTLWCSAPTVQRNLAAPWYHEARVRKPALLKSEKVWRSPALLR